MAFLLVVPSLALYWEKFARLDISQPTRFLSNSSLRISFGCLPLENVFITIRSSPWRVSIIHITEVVHTVVNMSSVQSTCLDPNRRWIVNLTHLTVNFTRKNSHRRKKREIWCDHCSRFVTQSLPKAVTKKPGTCDPGQSQSNLDNARSGSESTNTFGKDGKQTITVCDFPNWLNSSVEPWDACPHNMKLINHDFLRELDRR
jgi:hypothetical protein